MYYSFKIIKQLESVYGRDKSRFYLSYINTFYNILRPLSLLGPKTNEAVGKYIKFETQRAVNILSDKEVVDFLHFLFTNSTNEKLLEELKRKDDEKYFLPSLNDAFREITDVLEKEVDIGNLILE